MFEVLLPAPPSANSLYVNGATPSRNYSAGGAKPNKGVRYKSRKYKDWIKAASYMAMAARAKHSSQITPVIVVISAPQNRRRDLDNHLKPTLDLLVKCGIIPDDRGPHIYGITMRWHPKSETDMMRVQLVPPAVIDEEYAPV